MYSRPTPRCLNADQDARRCHLSHALLHGKPPLVWSANTAAPALQHQFLPITFSALRFTPLLQIEVRTTTRFPQPFTFPEYLAPTLPMLHNKRRRQRPTKWRLRPWRRYVKKMLLFEGNIVIQVVWCGPWNVVLAVNHRLRRSR